MCHIDNEKADELMQIEDIYGVRRKEDNEKVSLTQSVRPTNPLSPSLYLRR